MISSDILLLLLLLLLYVRRCGKACPASQKCIDRQCVCTNEWPNACPYTSPPGSAASTITICHNFTRSEVACGQCGVSCSASTECLQGKCSCKPGITACTDTATGATYCTNTTRSEEHCGTCFNSCPAGQFCVGGKCGCPSDRATACPWGLPVNGQQPTICVNISRNENHCGGCWQRCGWNEKCIDGKCTASCPRDWPERCPVPGVAGATVCANTLKDEVHCGACFKVCRRDQKCKDGQCVCRDGETKCSFGPNNAEICVNTKSSNVACGGCPNAIAPAPRGKVCPSNQKCSKGQCICPRDRPDVCVTSTGQTLCFNFRDDKSACGGCFKQCGPNQKCDDGRCKG
jgi:hypothetical protein